MALRIALRTDKDFSGVRDFVVAKGYSGFSVREVSGENEHWHWYLEGDKYRNIQAFRVNLTKTVTELKGNGAYSAKVCDQDYEKYWAYMCKGESNGCGAQVAWKHGLLFTDEKLEELHQAYWDENQARKKRKAQPVFQEVLESCKQLGVEWSDRRTIFGAYIKALYKRDKAINLYQIKSQVNLLMIKLAPQADDAIEVLLNQVPLI